MYFLEFLNSIYLDFFFFQHLYKKPTLIISFDIDIFNFVCHFFLIMAGRKGSIGFICPKC